MISFRHADLLRTLERSQQPVINVDFVINFPTANQGQEHAKKDGKYYATVEIMIDAPVTSGYNQDILERIESIAPGIFDPEGDWVEFATPDETFEDFARRLLNHYKKVLSPVSEETPTHSMQSTGRYQWIIHLKMKPLKSDI